MIWTTYTCQCCGKEFVREGRRKYLVCSHVCARLHKTKVDLTKLSSFATAGTQLSTMCRELKIVPTTARALLRRHGLHRTWSLRRFKKCAVAA